MSGNIIYDYFAGAVLNPRISNIDIKMWAEVRIPWILLFLISLGGVAKQFDQYGYVSPNQAFMVLATGLYINACAKGEELIPQTWDMVYEKFGWLLSFWNLAGVPFTYSYSIVFMATHDPEMYRFPLWANVALYLVLLGAYYVYDTNSVHRINNPLTDFISVSIHPCPRSLASRCSKMVICESGKRFLSYQAEPSKIQNIFRPSMGINFSSVDGGLMHANL